MPSLIFIVINLPEEKKTQKNHPGDCGLRLRIEQDGWRAKVLESQCSILTEHCCSRCGLQTSWKITHANYLGSSQPTKSETLAMGLNYLLWHKLSIELWCLLKSESHWSKHLSHVSVCVVGGVTRRDALPTRPSMYGFFMCALEFLLLWERPWSKSNLGRNGFTSFYTSRQQSTVEGSQGWNSSRSHGRVLLTGLLGMVFSACVLLTHRTTCSRMTPPHDRWALWHQLIIEKMPFRACP